MPLPVRAACPIVLGAPATMPIMATDVGFDDAIGSTSVARTWPRVVRSAAARRVVDSTLSAFGNRKVPSAWRCAARSASAQAATAAGKGFDLFTFGAEIASGFNTGVDTGGAYVDTTTGSTVRS